MCWSPAFTYLNSNCNIDMTDAGAANVDDRAHS